MNAKMHLQLFWKPNTLWQDMTRNGWIGIRRVASKVHLARVHNFDAAVKSFHCHIIPIKRKPFSKSYIFIERENICRFKRPGLGSHKKSIWQILINEAHFLFNAKMVWNSSSAQPTKSSILILYKFCAGCSWGIWYFDLPVVCPGCWC